MTEDEYLRLLDYDASSFLKVGMGAEAVLEVVKKLNSINLQLIFEKRFKHQVVNGTSKRPNDLRVVDGMRKSKHNAGVDDYGYFAGYSS